MIFCNIRGKVLLANEEYKHRSVPMADRLPRPDIDASEEASWTARMGLVGLEERRKHPRAAGECLEVIREAAVPRVISCSTSRLPLDSERIHRIAAKSLARLNPAQVRETLLKGQSVLTWSFKYTLAAPVRSAAA